MTLSERVEGRFDLTILVRRELAKHYLHLRKQLS